jgi:hypothetical protein
MTSFTSGTRDLIQMLSGYGKLILMIVALSLSIATDLNASSAYCGSGTSPKALIAKSDAATQNCQGIFDEVFHILISVDQNGEEPKRRKSSRRFKRGAWLVVTPLMMTSWGASEATSRQLWLTPF